MPDHQQNQEKLPPAFLCIEETAPRHISDPPLTVEKYKKEQLRESAAARWQNKKRKRKAQKRWRDKNPAKKDTKGRWVRALKTYGISEAEYEAKLTEQAGCCKLCGDPPIPGKRLCVDHDHDTGVVRGLLCRRCNLLLGLARENVELLLRMVGYLL
jgi:hypothetical protein